MTRTIATRYASRLLALIATWAVTLLSVDGAEFASLATQRALIALALIVLGWVLHVLTTYADDGTLPDVPAATAPLVINNYHGHHPEPPPPPPAP